MPTRVGPHTQGEENLVFGYDLGDVSNSYKGEPTENLIGNFVDTYNENYWVRATNYYKLEATAYVVQDESAPGGAYTYVTGNTSDTNAQLFWSAGNTICNEFGQQVTVSAWLRGSGVVRLIAYDDTTGYKSGPAITLTNEWTYYEHSTTFGSGGTEANHWVGVREITTGEYVQVAKVQWERKSHATQYVKGTRSVSGSLLDLTGNSTIDLTDVSFDSNAQMTFDGTSDRVVIPYADTDLDGDALFSVEGVFKRTLSNMSNRGFWGIGGDGSAAGINGYTYGGSGNRIGVDLWGYRTYTLSVEYPLNEYVHVIWVKRGLEFTADSLVIYVNGVEYTGSDFILQRNNGDGSVNLNTSTSGKGFVLGRVGPQTNNYYAGGEIGAFKIYNRALTTSEVKSNFNAIKGRFNIQ